MWGRSEENGARQKCLHQGPGSKPLLGAPENVIVIHLGETPQSFMLNQLLKQEKFMAVFLGCKIWQILSSLSENINAPSKFDDKA